MIRVLTMLLLAVAFCAGVESDPDQSEEVAEMVAPEREAWMADMGQDAYGFWASVVVREVPIRFRWVPPGTFLMGTQSPEAKNYEVEHEVTQSCGVWVAETETTQRLWKQVTGGNPSQQGESLDHPVDSVSHQEVMFFVRELSDLHGGVMFHMTTNAVWERACLAGRKKVEPADWRKIAWFQSEDDPDFAWPSHGPVAQLAPNPWGLYDMHGNVAEMTADGMKIDLITGGVDPWRDKMGPYSGLRGGSCTSLKPEDLYHWKIGRVTDHGKRDDVGFRLCVYARMPDGDQEAAQE